MGIEHQHDLYFNTSMSFSNSWSEYESKWKPIWKCESYNFTITMSVSMFVNLYSVAIV